MALEIVKTSVINSKVSILGVFVATCWSSLFDFEMRSNVHASFYSFGCIFSIDIKPIAIFLTGEGCSEIVHFDCNYPAIPNLPYGPWIVSICPAYCDKTRAMCFCGQGTKYPNRPLAEGCGFKTM